MCYKYPCEIFSFEKFGGSSAYPYLCIRKWGKAAMFLWDKPTAIRIVVFWSFSCLVRLQVTMAMIRVRI